MAQTCQSLCIGVMTEPSIFDVTWITNILYAFSVLDIDEYKSKYLSIISYTSEEIV